MAEVNPHIGQLLRDAYRRFDEELAAGLSAPRARLGVRPAHDAVLAYLDRDGTRASVLAERSRLTRRPDPSDGRAKIIQYTPEALKHFDASRRVIAALERRWASELGRRNYAALRAALEQLLRK